MKLVDPVGPCPPGNAQPTIWMYTVPCTSKVEEVAPVEHTPGSKPQLGGLAAKDWPTTLQIQSASLAEPLTWAPDGTSCFDVEKVIGPAGGSTTVHWCKLLAPVAPLPVHPSARICNGVWTLESSPVEIGAAHPHTGLRMLPVRVAVV